MSIVRIVLVIIATLIYLSCNAQNKDCTIIFSLNGDTTINMTDSIFFEKSGHKRVYFYNDNIFINNQKKIHFAHVNYYSEMTYIKSKKKYFLYIYPIYQGEAGPGIWELHNGVMIALSSGKVYRKISYFDFIEICDYIPRFIKINHIAD